MLWTDKSLHLSFGIASALDVAARLGRLGISHAQLPLGRLRLRWRLRNQLIGAVLMGFGGDHRRWAAPMGPGYPAACRRWRSVPSALASILADSRRDEVHHLARRAPS